MAKNLGEITQELNIMDTAARNFIIMVQEKLEAAVIAPVVERQIKAALADTNFLKRMIEILLTEFVNNRNKEQKAAERGKPAAQPQPNNRQLRRPPRNKQNIFVC